MGLDEMDLIDRQKLIDVFTTYPTLWVSYCEDGPLDEIVEDVLQQAREKILSDIASVPAVTPKRPHGKWIYDPKTCLRHCSECGWTESYETTGLEMAHCIGCGADMREVTE